MPKEERQVRVGSGWQGPLRSSLAERDKRGGGWGPAGLKRTVRLANRLLSTKRANDSEHGSHVRAQRAATGRSKRARYGRVRGLGPLSPARIPSETDWRGRAAFLERSESPGALWSGLGSCRWVLWAEAELLDEGAPLESGVRLDVVAQMPNSRRIHDQHPANPGLLTSRSALSDAFRGCQGSPCV